MFTLGQCAALACVFEASAPKVGNVHRGADFEDMTYIDLITAAVAIGPVFDAAAGGAKVGGIVHSAIDAMRRAVACNAYLGTILLMAPLAAVPRDVPLAQGVREVLARLDADDARLVYDAIRLAKPGGLGRVDEADVAASPPIDLVAAMRLAAERDMVARQYANGFATVLDEIAPALREALSTGHSLADTIVLVQLQTMSRYPDSLTARKCGAATARRAADHAAKVLAAGKPGEDAYESGLADLDFWLRSDGHRRNPGTTADLIAAALFALLRDSELKPPWSLTRKG
jgi:triphosphoribosyl-dephospho-CoA synthase